MSFYIGHYYILCPNCRHISWDHFNSKYSRSGFGKQAQQLRNVIIHRPKNCHRNAEKMDTAAQVVGRWLTDIITLTGNCFMLESDPHDHILGGFRQITVNTYEHTGELQSGCKADSCHWFLLIFSHKTTLIGVSVSTANSWKWHAGTWVRVKLQPRPTWCQTE